MGSGANLLRVGCHMLVDELAAESESFDGDGVTSELLVGLGLELLMVMSTGSARKCLGDMVSWWWWWWSGRKVDRKSVV